MSITARFAAVSLALAAAASAHAAPYVASFDPVFGAPFNGANDFPFNLGWRGTSTLDISDECFTTAGTAITTGSVLGCTATVLQTVVEFYNADNGSNAPTQGTATFLAPQAITSLFFTVGSNGNQITGFGTGQSAFVSVVTSLTALAGTDFAIEFNLGLLAGDQSDGPYNGPLLTWRQCDSLRGCESAYCPPGGTNDPQNPVTTYTINRVPEPASLALAMAALVGGVGAARRRRG